LDGERCGGKEKKGGGHRKGKKKHKSFYLKSSKTTTGNGSGKRTSEGRGVVCMIREAQDFSVGKIKKRGIERKHRITYRMEV